MAIISMDVQQLWVTTEDLANIKPFYNVSMEEGRLLEIPFPGRKVSVVDSLLREGFFFWVESGHPQFLHAPIGDHLSEC